MNEVRVDEQMQRVDHLVAFAATTAAPAAMADLIVQLIEDPEDTLTWADVRQASLLAHIAFVEGQAGRTPEEWGRAVVVLAAAHRRAFA